MPQFPNVALGWVAAKIIGPDTVSGYPDVALGWVAVRLVDNNGDWIAGGGGGADLSFRFTQNTAAASWVIVHNLGKYPSVTVCDSSGHAVIGDVQYDSLNQLTLNFSAPFAGSANLN